MLEAVRRAVAGSHSPESGFTDFAPTVAHHTDHSVDVPETRASVTAVGKTFDWQSRVFFPESSASDGEKCKAENGSIQRTWMGVGRIKALGSIGNRFPVAGALDRHQHLGANLQQ